MSKVMMLILGGSAGTLARYYLSIAVHQWWGVRFPYGPLTVNLLGCFLIGFFLMAGEKLGWSATAELMLAVGFCAAFTTFSTFVLDVAHLLNKGHTLLALVNVIASVLIGFAFLKLGILIGKML